MADRPRVTDWATDFDHIDPDWVDDPFPIWDDLRDRCPVAHTDRYEGVYLPTRYADIRAIAYDTEHFSSRRIVVRELPVGAGRLFEELPSPPVTSDPPDHAPVRKLLSPPFSPQAIRKLEARTRSIASELIDGLAGQPGCDAAADYAQWVPLRVIAHLLGVPESDGVLFRRWIHQALEAGVTEHEQFVAALREMTVYLGAEVARRREVRARGGSSASAAGSAGSTDEPAGDGAPGGDLIDFLLDAQRDGHPLSDMHLLGMLRLILVAGIDTTWSAIGASLWHLASHPADRARLVREPDLWPTAIEELLRAYAPVTMARLVIADTELAGCPLAARQMVLLCFPAANRDPAVFERPHEVVLDRAENPHAAFGLGIHRCLGSNLARMELRVALEEWLRRIPEFRLADPAAVTWSRGMVRGPRTLPLLFG